ncbi:hypothetical protein RM545_05015 [Zunongwangia sp. F260]|uniref:Uncharacterized protein n=1 Tax=Autumnicola lenta TaxID=3075593 RepID=A0ABU3CI59_9FLAO|nr:hypothetical protein [Zunongwangia sp. F260]MDT0646042.1 hypothetical protein [Zunongwangia sp. F260]
MLKSFSPILSILFFGSFSHSSIQAQKSPEVDIDGALRFNYNLSSWKPEQKPGEVILAITFS